MQTAVASHRKLNIKQESKGNGVIGNVLHLTLRKPLQLPFQQQSFTIFGQYQFITWYTNNMPKQQKPAEVEIVLQQTHSDRLI